VTPAVRTTKRQSYFDDYPDLFARYVNTWDRLTGDEFTRWLDDQLPGGAHAVELGCGTGRLLPTVAAKYANVLGVDLSAPMLEYAAGYTAGLSPDRHGRIRLDERSLLDVHPDLDGRFDVVLSAFTLHHAGPPETVLPHVRSLVRPGGRAVLIDMIDPGEWRNPEWHRRRAFAEAEQVHDLGATHEEVADLVRLLLHPTWRRQCAADVPLTLGGFHRHYRDVFPGAVFHDRLHLAGIMAAAVWSAPLERRG
jgi:SAM-dependent methyltransferase